MDQNVYQPDDESSLYRGPYRLFVPLDTLIFAVLTGVLFVLYVHYSGIWHKKDDEGKDPKSKDGITTYLRVLLSVCGNYAWAVSVLGFPGEIYSYNTMLLEVGVAIFFFVPIGAFLFYPTFFRLKVCTVFEYLELRFDSRGIRWFISVIYVLETIMLYGVVLWAAVVSLTISSGVPYWLSIVILALCLLAYAHVQGKGTGGAAGWWVDLLQGVVLLGMICAVIITGINNVGGIDEVMTIGYDEDAIRNFDFRFAPFVRRTSINVVLGQGFMWASIFVCQQSQAERFIYLPSLTKSLVLLVVSTIFITLVIDVTCFTGFILFTNYYDCDPVLLGALQRSDMIVMYYVADKFNRGMLGLFVAFLWRSSLVGAANNVHGLTRLINNDFLQYMSCYSNLSEERKKDIRHYIALFICICLAGFSCVAGELGTFVGAFFSIIGGLGGPLIGLYLLGLFVPITNKIGAVLGTLAGLAVNLSVILGALALGIKYRTVPTSIDECDFSGDLPHLSPESYMNPPTTSSVPFAHDYYDVPVAYYKTMVMSNDSTEHAVYQYHYVTEFPDKWFTFSYALYGFIGCAVTFVVGIFFSLLTMKIKGCEPKDSREGLPYYHPLVIQILKCMHRSDASYDVKI